MGTMIGLKYNKKYEMWEIWNLKSCECGNHICKEFIYGSSLEDCLNKIKKDLNSSKSGGKK